MKIAFILNSFPATSETFILNQITGLLDLGHEVKVYAMYKSNEKVIHNDYFKYNLSEKTYFFNKSEKKFKRIINILPIFLKYLIKKPNKTIRLFNYSKYGTVAIKPIFFSAFPFFEKNDFDIIHCQFGTLGFLGISLKELNLFNKKLIVSFRGYDMGKILYSKKDFPTKELFNKTNIFLTVNSDFKQKLISLGCDKKKILVHYSAIDLNKFTFKYKKIENNRINILTVGRLVEIKGISYAIEAIAKLIEKYNNFEIKYTIIGDGPLYNELNNLTNQLNLNNFVKFLGKKNQTEIIKELHQSNIFIAPSITPANRNQEGIPNSLKEAMATGVPVISTNQPGILELISHEETGLIVPEKKSTEITNKIEFIINNPEKINKIVYQARKKIEDKFDKNKLNIELENIYKNYE
jgi:colanic acid/amylovoran biosynthesis glycosyltransferase